MSNLETAEKELREKLEISIPDGMYDIGTGDFACWIGKRGYIDFRVALLKAVMSYEG